MAIALIQSAIKDVKGVNNTTLAYASNIAAGHLLLADIVTFQSTAGTTISTPTDTLANEYSAIAAQQNSSANTVHLRSFLVPNSNSGADTVTADISGIDTGEITYVISEWSGLAQSSPLSGTPVLAGPATTSTPSTGSFTPAEDNCLVVAVLNAGGTPVTITEPAGWTQLREYEGGNSSVTLSVIYKIQTTATAENPQWTLSASRSCMTHIFALKSGSVTGTGSILEGSDTLFAQEGATASFVGSRRFLLDFG